MVSDLSLELVEAAVRGRLGRPLRYLAATDSTNERALEWLREGVEEGALVVADHQSAGRGRRGRTWVSGPGEGLLFSLVLRPPATALELLTTSLGVALSETIESLYALDARIKWPNDVTVGGRKIAGILVESRTEKETEVACVAGVGVNVWTEETSLPAELRGRATSVRRELGPRVAGANLSRARLLGEFLVQFEGTYESLRAEAGRRDLVVRAALRSELLGRAVVVRLADGTSVEGRAAGLDGSGRLVVEGGNGSVTLSAGEVERLRDAHG